MEGILLQTSFIAAFVAGMVALFAPCCISFLLPAYLGSVFKEKEKIVLMTLIFGMGIFVVMLPAVLGVAALSKALFVYHDQLYIVGGLVMIVSSIVTFLGIKFPMPSFPGVEKKSDPWSVFVLGIFSGITSACCAPVLIGILTLTFLSPSFFGAILIGAIYVLGMVIPLLIISLFLSGKAGKFLILRKKVLSFSFFGERTVLMGSLIASIIFFVTGVLIIYLQTSGRLAMLDIDQFTKVILNAGNITQAYVGGNFWVNFGFIVLLFGFLWFVFKKRL